MDTHNVVVILKFYHDIVLFFQNEYPIYFILFYDKLQGLPYNLMLTFCEWTACFHFLWYNELTIFLFGKD